MIQINNDLDYEDGKSFWSHDTGGPHGKKIKAGTRAGSLHPDGYWRVQVNGKLMLEHRIILEAFLERKIFPKFEVDHINRLPGDNRVSNLREVSPRTNQLNSNDRKGIYPHGNGWQAVGQFDRKQWTKYFHEEKDAQAYYDTRHAQDLAHSLELDAQEIRRLEKCLAERIAYGKWQAFLPI